MSLVATGMYASNKGCKKAGDGKNATKVNREQGRDRTDDPQIRSLMR